MSNTIFRVGTANMYDNAIRNVSARQTSLVNLQEPDLGQACGACQRRPRVGRPGRTRADPHQPHPDRAARLENQRNAIAQAESTMGDAINLVQEARQLMVSAGSGTLTSNDRATIANQLQSLRDQLTAVANRTDTNGIPLLGALGSAQSPLWGRSTAHRTSLQARPAKRPVMASRCPTRWTVIRLHVRCQRDGSFHAAITPGTSTVIVPGPTHQRARHGPAQPCIDHLGHHRGRRHNFNKNPATGLAYTYSVSFSASRSTPPPTPCLPPTTSAAPTLPSCPGSTNAQPDQDRRKGRIQHQRPAARDVDESHDAAHQSGGRHHHALARQRRHHQHLAPGQRVQRDRQSHCRDQGGPNSNVAAQAISQALANVDIGLERMSNIRSYAGDCSTARDRITGDQASGQNSWRQTVRGPRIWI
jgi:flagellar hook-associated protein 3 FlgL